MKKHAFFSNISIKTLITLILCIAPNIIFAPQKNHQKLPFNSRGYTSMHTAALENDATTIKVLASTLSGEVNRHSGFDANKSKADKNTPAHLAVSNKSWKALSMLIAFNADLLAYNADNKRPCKSNITEKDTKDYSNAILRGIALKKELFKPKSTSTKRQSISKLDPCAPSFIPNRKKTLDPRAQSFIPSSDKNFQTRACDQLAHSAEFFNSRSEIVSPQRALNPQAPSFIPRSNSNLQKENR